MLRKNADGMECHFCREKEHKEFTSEMNLFHGITQLVYHRLRLFVYPFVTFEYFIVDAIHFSI